MHALIIDGAVFELIEQTAAPLEDRFPPELVAAMIPAGPDVAQGDLWDGSKFTKPAPITPANVTSVTMRQARLALLAAGKLDAAEAAIDAHGPAARIEWDYATTVHRDNPLVHALAAALDVDLDEMFVTAAQL